jgi:uncharacterized protein (TIGR02246 family)
MKTITVTMLALFLFTATANSQPNPLTTLKKDLMETKKTVESMIAVMQNGWNHADGNEFVKPFADTIEFVDIRGTLHSQSTRQYIAQAHAGLWKSIYKDSKILYELLQTVVLNDHALLVNLKATLDAPVGPLAGKTSSTITMVLLQTDGEWKVRGFHNTLVAKQ